MQPQNKKILLFNKQFNKLHHIITDLLDVSEKHDFWLCLTEIHKRAKKSKLFEAIDDLHYDNLRTLNTVRNLAIHTNDWIKIGQKTLNTIENILKSIEHLKTQFNTNAIDIFKKKVFIAKNSDKLSLLIEAMSIRNFSHVPIYTDDGQFRGVFSQKSLLLWIQKSEKILDKNIEISQIAIDTKNLEYIFLKNKTPLHDIEKFFQEYSRNRKKLGAIFLTKSWKSSDTIEGIITAWDLPMIGES